MQLHKSRSLTMDKNGITSISVPTSLKSCRNNFTGFIDPAMKDVAELPRANIIKMTHWLQAPSTGHSLLHDTDREETNGHHPLSPTFPEAVA